MRTIKFRGRYPEESEFKGEWRYGNGANKEQGLIIDTSNEPAQINNSQTYHIDKNTIGQCIGLNDRNGREIYEGDILRLWKENGKEYGRLLPVKYCDLWCAFVVEDEPIKEQYILWKDFLEWQVVGNIYDYPGLEYKESKIKEGTKC